MALDFPDDQEEVSSCIVVKGFTNINILIDKETKTDFENLFSRHAFARFTYLPSFQRVLVTYQDRNDAALAKTELHDKIFKGDLLKIYFKEDAKKVGDDFLAIPKTEKLFLISPPASPPVGWEQIVEAVPVVNYDLISAVARLEIPGQPVHLITKTDSYPGIVVIGCDDPVSQPKYLKTMKGLSRKEVQTKRPPLQ